ncbi:hypothetical protein SAMN05428949_0695 [Chitinophaga sp. YR627]|uniref:hypothetical protein n=1 Tax=Chitinophaga sp. YR627 TaxID=1881041 RepID=UPI0008E9B397|nr:hypothetical protein [Chitinophaga sp. YR627]SFM76076.1 hypothetical protein SAMN05428949_0695 [Chitinophaga sp. YR627]
MNNTANRQLILNGDTPVYQLLVLILLAGAPVFIFIDIDLPWSLFAISAWVLLSFVYIEFTRRFYSVYFENGEVIVYNLLNMKGRRFPIQDFDKVTFSQRRSHIPGAHRFLINFKDGKKFNFAVGEEKIKLNGPMSTFNSETEILVHVNGLILAFIAGNQHVPAKPFAGKYWR